MTKMLKCSKCRKNFRYAGKGRPASKCRKCKEKK